MKTKRDIWRVVTLPEAAENWKLSRTTIIWQIWQGNLAARKANGAWLLSKADMVKLFGKPDRRLVDASDNPIVYLP